MTNSYPSHTGTPDLSSTRRHMDVSWLDMRSTVHLQEKSTTRKGLGAGDMCQTMRWRSGCFGIPHSQGDRRRTTSSEETRKGVVNLRQAPRETVTESNCRSLTSFDRNEADVRNCRTEQSSLIVTFTPNMFLDSVSGYPSRPVTPRVFPWRGELGVKLRQTNQQPERCTILQLPSSRQNLQYTFLFLGINYQITLHFWVPQK